jgi:hypothetical protein
VERRLIAGQKTVERPPFSPPSLARPIDGQASNPHKHTHTHTLSLSLSLSNPNHQHTPTPSPTHTPPTHTHTHTAGSPCTTSSSGRASKHGSTAPRTRCAPMPTSSRMRWWPRPWPSRSRFFRYGCRLVGMRMGGFFFCFFGVCLVGAGGGDWGWGWFVGG